MGGQQLGKVLAVTGFTVKPLILSKDDEFVDSAAITALIFENRHISSKIFRLFIAQVYSVMKHGKPRSMPESTLIALACVKYAQLLKSVLLRLFY